LILFNLPIIEEVGEGEGGGADTKLKHEKTKKQQRRLLISGQSFPSQHSLPSAKYMTVDTLLKTVVLMIALIANYSMKT
jgi:hypothetical protein